MQKLSVLLVIVLIFLGGADHFVPYYTIQLNDQPTEIGTREDPMARANYELTMLADPATGQLPIKIRERELRFSSKIPERTAYHARKNQRVAAREYLAAGPFNVGGRTRAAAFDIRDEDIIIAGGVSGGIWKTTDGGFTWARTSDVQHRNSVTSLAQDIRTGKRNIWYYGTGELLGNSARSIAAPYRGVGIYRSTDDGNSWQLLTDSAATAPQNFFTQLQYIWRIETNHTNLDQDEVLVAAFGGILRSLDGGSSWNAVLGQTLTDLSEDTDLNCANAPFYTEIQKTSNGQFFAALSSSTSTHRGDCEEEILASSAGFYFSSNGADWEEITPPDFPTYHERTVIGFSAGESLVYFLTLEATSNGNEFFQFRRFDLNRYLNGMSLSQCWTNLANNLPEFGGEFGNLDAQGGYNMLVQGHPEIENTIFIGGTNLYRSTTAFMSNNATKWIGGYHTSNSGAVYPDHYPDQHLLLFYPSEPNRMISANDGGLRKTTNNRADSVRWSSMNNGYLTSQFYTIAQQHDEATDAVIGGMQDNGTYLRDGADIESPNWTRILGGDGGYAAIAPNKELFYTSFQNGQVYRLTLNDSKQLTSFARVDPVGAGDDVPVLFINPFLLDPQNPNRLFFTGGDVLWRNENILQIPAGSQKPTKINWTKISGTRISNGFYAALAKSNNGDTLLAGTFSENPRIVRVMNASELSPAVESLYSAVFPEGGHISCIAISPENANHFLVIFSNYNIPSVFMTRDGGDSFEDVSGNLEESPDGTGAGPSVRWAEIIPTTDGLEYFVGTSTGLYSTANIDGTTPVVWTKESEDKIGSTVIPMIDYRAIDGRLVIATHGSGTFRTFIENARPLNNQQQPQAKTTLSQNFPNPFRYQTYIDFSIPEDGSVKIDLYDRQGKLIKNLLWGPQFAGKSRIIWDGTNTTGIQVKPGVYHYVLQYKNAQLSKRIIYRP